MMSYVPFPQPTSVVVMYIVDPQWIFVKRKKNVMQTQIYHGAYQLY